MSEKPKEAKGCPFLNKNQFCVVTKAGAGWISGTTGAGMSWSNFFKIVMAITDIKEHVTGQEAD
ncbi:MAG: hypothetical protein JL50_00810 [Peptococcaceae bacterium BICA1-7]|nr:MAG: hypothetical protein JL50_00810 [Peptococcaceae bacterium BICA1-7]HBV98071.1 hypothetical protein [Desulfotomaculum sp.]